jgi:hypothetical protein
VVSSFGQGGGGGWGGPPQGGGGGGFGPPPQGGGGGFGPPPQGGGGGYGAPPTGGGYGGGAPPPSEPLKHIPFSPEDVANIGGMGRFAMIAAVTALAAGVFTLITQIVQGIVLQAEGSALAGQVCGGAIGLLINGLLAFFLFRASSAIKAVVDTDDADQQNLVKSFAALKAYFMTKGILYILLIVLICGCGVLMVFFGAMLAAALSGSSY